MVSQRMPTKSGELSIVIIAELLFVTGMLYFSVSFNQQFRMDAPSTPLETSVLKPHLWRIAILISGTFRTFDKVSSSILRHVFEPLRKMDSIQVDAFLYITAEPESDGLSRNETELYLNLFQLRSNGTVVGYQVDEDETITVEPAIIMDWQRAERKHSGIIHQMNGWKQGFRLVTSYEHQQEFRYDFVCRMRSDMLWVKDFPDPRGFPKNIPSLPTNYISDRGVLKGCIDDKILMLPRQLAPSWFNILDTYKHNNGSRQWFGFYQFLTDVMVQASNLSVAKFGTSSMTEEICGDGILAPFNYVEFAAITWTKAGCLQSHSRDNWSGYSDLCPHNSSSWVLPSGSRFCSLSNSHQKCPPEILADNYFKVNAYPVRQFANRSEHRLNN